MTRVLLLHGWAMTPAVWQPMRAALGEEARIDVYAPFLSGHDAKALAPALPPNTIVVGWSLGALLALELAHLFPERVAHLILIGATPRFVASPDWPHGLDAATVAAFSDGYAAQPAATLRRFLALQTLGDAARRSLLPRLEAACVPHTDAPLPALADGLKILAETDLRARLTSITQPADILHGEGDALMPCAAARWMADALPNARLGVLENAGHALPLSRPEDCAALIRERLDTWERENRP